MEGTVPHGGGDMAAGGSCSLCLQSGSRERNAYAELAFSSLYTLGPSPALRSVFTPYLAQARDFLTGMLGDLSSRLFLVPVKLIVLTIAPDSSKFMKKDILAGWGTHPIIPGFNREAEAGRSL